VESFMRRDFKNFSLTKLCLVIDKMLDCVKNIHDRSIIH